MMDSNGGLEIDIIGGTVESQNPGNVGAGVCALIMDNGMSFYFPLPLEMSFNASYGWGSEEMGAIGHATELAKQIGDGASITDAAGSMAAMVGAAAAGNLFKVAQSQGVTNKAVNPREMLLFSGVKLREFSLNFNIASKSMQKMKQNLFTLNALYHIAAPDLDMNGAFFTLPNKGHLYIKDNNRDIIRPRAVVVKSIETNLTPDGGFNTFVDGTPMHFTLSIGFLETELPTKKTESTIFGA